MSSVNTDKDGLERFADSMTRILPVFMKSFAQRRTDELYKGKITMQQFVALTYLNYHAGKYGATMGGLAKNLYVTMPAVTGVVNRLIRSGYCIRLSDVRDRRIVRVTITPKGARLVRKMYRQRKEMIMRIFAKINRHDRGQYLRILKNVAQILNEEE
ncbi:MAG: hypothetical protein COV72_00900 [Candidatus Omnitrophica bacterium CG11_big_fil_rev_8_21_14_0_20_42_13]|uniref:HTH marR-type domain-containing protein n=1 Tax=Candidatus Ghiorseimicrobium undicola TaxID=1974746 RepID=A0A2H0M2C4_9BACT|nr:MAG: hypothetical protein COV72_00900 [Candidatus Omnitrophica bacterium CG11_big_fil_rev_8_21_14_0_20_42_13]